MKLRHVDPFVLIGVFRQIRSRKVKQSNCGPKPVLLQMHKAARELNQAFVKGIVGAISIGEPEFFQYVMSFEE